MRAIILYTARVDNSRARRAAGATITVGDEPDQIDEITALSLVDRSLAADADAPIEVVAHLLGADGEPVDPPSGDIAIDITEPGTLNLTDEERANLPPLEEATDAAPITGKAKKLRAD